MRDIYIIGAGGMGKEVQWLINRINEKGKAWRIAGFLDDSVQQGTTIHDVPVIGPIDLINLLGETCAVCAIGDPKLKQKVLCRITNSQIDFPALIDPSAIVAYGTHIGRGSIVQMMSIVGVDANIGEFVLININSSVHHDSSIGNFSTVFNKVELAGHVRIGSETEIGSRTVVIPNKVIGDHVIVGAGAVVVKDLTEPGTYIGVPAQRRHSDEKNLDI